ENLRSYNPEKSKNFPKYPAFIKYHDDFSMTYMRSNGFKIKKLGPRKVRVFGIPKIKDGIKIGYYKEISGEVRQQALIKEKDKYYLCVTFKEGKKHWPSKNKQVGIDLGVVRNIQLSNG